MRKKLSLFLILTIVFPFLGLQCTKGVPPEVRKASQPVVLNWWSPFLDSSSVEPLIEAYRAIHPNVSINFRKIRYEDYEKELLNALAEDRGPDIFSLNNSDLYAWRTKLLPMPPSVTLPFQETQGTIKKEVVTVLKTLPTIGLRGVKNEFVDVVASDVLLPSPEDKTSQLQVYGLPLSLDTLALYYNKDMLNLAGLPTPPQTWTEFQTAVKKLTKFNQEGEIIQSGGALGTARNVERAADLLALLMMQNGAQMIDDRGQVAFHQIPENLKGRGVPPGEEALIFYTDFANPTKEVYSWNESMPNSLQAFAQGKTAFFFGYSYHLPILKNLAPKLNFAIAPIPQIENNPTINFANYWVETVSKKTKNPQFAWDFLQFATTNQQLILNFLNTARRPTALRKLIVKQGEDLELEPFINQVLTAKSWYKGNDYQTAQESLLTMIEQVNHNELLPKDAIRLAAQKVAQTLR